jgi:CCR4-NOT transcription complex subunit 3
MELFKICEKETKTKAYSKEGLARDANDPKEIEREEKRNWINECLQRLGDIIDSVEVELEKASGGRGKSKNKDSVRVSL